MEITRMYQPQKINWFLIPDLLEKAIRAVPDNQKVDSLFKYELSGAPGFTIATFSQFVEIESTEDFLHFIKTSSEIPTRVEARVDCIKHYGDGSSSKTRPGYFDFTWREDRVEIEIWRSASELALKLLDEFEKNLELQPLQLLEQSEEQQDNKKQPLQRTIFLAHSFDDSGRSYAYQLTRFLSLLGFEIATGEGFSPERVSAKVKRRLASQELVVAILSERLDFTWLIQEMAGASFIEKPLFVLVEEGVDFKPAVLGDLEYIGFAKGKITDCFTPVLEGLRELGFQFTDGE